MIVIYSSMAIFSIHQDQHSSSGKKYIGIVWVKQVTALGRATWKNGRGLNSHNGRMQFCLRIVAVSCVFMSVLHCAGEGSFRCSMFGSGKTPSWSIKLCCWLLSARETPWTHVSSLSLFWYLVPKAASAQEVPKRVVTLAAFRGVYGVRKC